MTAVMKLIGMGEVHVSRGDTDFSCVGVGSGIVVLTYDKDSTIAACGHFIFPRAPVDHDRGRPGKYIDTGLAWIFKSMFELGANPAAVRAALVGGASLTERGHDAPPPHDLGVRNIEAAYRTLSEFGVCCRAQELGGRVGRTVTLLAKDGTVKVRACPEPDHLLCTLRG